MKWRRRTMNQFVNELSIAQADRSLGTVLNNEFTCGKLQLSSNRKN